MSDLQRQQRGYMNALPVAPHWEDTADLTPLADAIYFSTLHRCRRLLPADFPNSSLLIVNGGWGADTAYFERYVEGSITVSDISERMLEHTRARCQHARVCTAATESLPFGDGAFDYVGVRSGLHHLLDPWAGLDEMIRVARKGVFFIEGHQTPLVPLLVKLGALEDVEEAGNVVYRFRRGDVAAHGKRCGAGRLVVDTGWFLQIPLLIWLAKRIPGRLPAAMYWAVIKMVNVVFGSLGNAFIMVWEKSTPRQPNPHSGD